MILDFDEFKSLNEVQMQSAPTLNPAFDQGLTVSGYTMYVNKMNQASKEFIDSLQASNNDKPNFIVSDFKILKIYNDASQNDIVAHVSFIINDTEYLGSFSNIMNEPLLKCEIFNTNNNIKDFRFRLTNLLAQELLEKLIPEKGLWITMQAFLIADSMGNKIQLNKNTIIEVHRVTKIKPYMIQIKAYGNIYTVTGKNFWLFKKFLKKY